MSDQTGAELVDELGVARDSISRYLPAGHPAIAKLDKAIDAIDAIELDDITMPEPAANTELYDELVDLLDDFARGIRTWDEIHDHIHRALT